MFRVTLCVFAHDVFAKAEVTKKKKSKAFNGKLLRETDRKSDVSVRRKNKLTSIVFLSEE